jgi:hypothetical protein
VRRADLMSSIKISRQKIDKNLSIIVQILKVCYWLANFFLDLLECCPNI